MSEGQMIQQLARFFGLVFLVVGILGFIPGIVADYDELAFSGQESKAELFGLFRVSVLLNVFHMLLGVAGLVLAREWEAARRFMLASAVLNGALCVYGLIAGDSNFVPTNGAGDALHGVLGFVSFQCWVANLDDRDKVGFDSPAPTT